MDDLLAEFERPRHDTREDKERRRRLFAAFGIAGLSLVALGSLTTNALFTDTDSVDSSGFTTGTVDLETSPNSPATVGFSAGNMAPGDTEYGAVSVQNVGSLGLRWAMTAAADNTDGNNLRSQLDFEVYLGVAPANCDAAGVAAATPVSPAAPVGAGATYVTFADDLQLGAGADEDLCVVASLPLSTGNAFQDSTTTVTFTFDAEQTRNN